MFHTENLTIINIMAASVDGKISAHKLESTEDRNQSGLVCNEDFLRMRKLVATCDAVFLGARTLSTEKGAFRVANLTPKQAEPEWIVFTRSGEISFSHEFWQQKNIPKSIFFVSSFNKSDEPFLKIEEKQFPFATINCYLGNIIGLLQYLKEKNYKKIALLGGGELNAAFWEQKLVDELFITISPIIIGNKNAPALISSETILKSILECEKVSQSGDFIFIDYKVKK
ncbi:dihydrofolate reductase family protein [Fluviispira sanaruensis]|uniref:Pyrimidine reductase n=1 Tax=Fluviispira sanaruensis TaxID=2493639 RepID=A0A4P2VIE6_FLUSA|nr:dihydrofolate reductase family protein [Fluviispira sanaruensis]BBH52178.1 pyrimidine reductase [Fluviispira sanaruensis]